MRLRLAAVLAAAGILMSAIAGGTLAAEPVSGYRSYTNTEPILPQVFKVDLARGYVLYVFPDRRAQFVRVLFYRQGRGRFRVSRGVYYGVESESSEGSGDQSPDLSAKVEAGAVSAHFGPLGSIDMHFVPVGGVRRYRPFCGGEGVAFTRGRYEGSIWFQGGDGHPSVETAVAQVAPRAELRSRCTGGVVAVGPPTLPGAELAADSIRSNTPYFKAFKNAPVAPSHIGAAINEDQRGVRIIRFVELSAPSSIFQYDRSLTKATVQPPTPFSGVGHYNAERDRRHRWSGDLAVDFPGREDVSVTHPPLYGFINPARWIPPHPRKGG